MAIRILYAAYKYDPRNPDLSSGADFNFFTAFTEAGCDVFVVVPDLSQTHFVERGFQRLHKRVLQNRYAKFPISKLGSASQAVNEAAASFKPDVVFGMFPPSSFSYAASAPYIHRLDTTFWGWQQDYPEFSRLGLAISMWQERRTFDRASRIVTHSDWTRQILTNKYRVPSDKIVMFPNPARLLYGAEDEIGDIDKEITLPVQLLFVGKDYARKDLATALETVRILSDNGLPVELSVCGRKKIESQENVRYVGFFKKSDPAQYAQYLDLFRNTHLLLHPARFDPSPIVTSEAAAFGVPTITNANGGLATSVKHGISGIVLPKWSPAFAYAAAIQELAENPDLYRMLCRRARTRFRQELSWRVAGKRLVAVLENLIETDEFSPEDDT